MSKGSKKDNIINIPRTRGSDVGKILFIGMIFVYIVFAAYSLSNRTTVDVYEVEAGSIEREHSYTGLILREETVVTSEGDGYVNYYVPSGKKVAVGTTVYCIDESGSLTEYIESHRDELQAFSDPDISSIHSSLEEYSKTIGDIDFGSTYTLAEKLDAMATEYRNLSILGNIGNDLRRLGSSLNDYHSTATVMVSYYIDGYEELKLADVEEDLFDTDDHQRTLIGSGELTSKGDPVYRLVTSDDWQIVFQLGDEDIASFGDNTSLRITLTSTDITTTASFETMIGSDGNSYGVLSLSAYLTYYLDDRFLSFEIIQNDVSGLKIPEKSVTTKEFQVIPSRYYTTDDETESSGFYKEVVTSDGTDKQFCIVDIYNNDGEYCYIECTDSSELQVGDVVIAKDDSSDRYVIAETRPLEGVYNINKGYTVFKRIERLESSNGYVIIAKNTSYGLSVYDRIVLDASTVGDGQVLYRQ